MARAAVIPQPPPKRGRTTTSTTAARGRPSVATATTAAARAKAKTPTTKTATEPRKRATRVGAEEASDDDDDEIGTIQEKKTTARARGKAAAAAATTTTTTGTSRGRKPAARPATPQDESDDEDELAQVDVPKKRVGRPKKETTTAKSAEPAARPRGRPRGTTNVKSTTATARTRTRTESAQPEESSRPTEVTINSAALRSNILKGPAKKKTVTFQDPSDSEEEEEEPAPAPAARRRRGTPASKRQTGLAAKPARKAAATTGRVRKPATKEAKPLSPKKANQITKSISSYVSSDGEDDELAGGKDQLKFHVESPTKHGSEKTGLSSPVKRINLTPRPSRSVDENGNPVRRSIDFNDIMSMASPTREPSPSPFHYTLRGTPRRVGLALTEEHTKPISQPDFGRSQNSPLKASPKKALLETPRGGGGFAFSGDMKPSFQPNFTPGENSPLKASPKKGHFDTPKASSMAPWDGTKPLTQSNFTPAQNSPLKTSPRKGNLAASFSESAMKSSTPSFNARISMLQSPAKRVASPFKGMTPKRSALFAPREDATPREVENEDAPAPSTTQVEEPLMLQELDEVMDEDKEEHEEESEDELGGEPDHGMHHPTEAQTEVDEEMDEGQEQDQDQEERGDELAQNDDHMHAQPESQLHFVIDEEMEEGQAQEEPDHDYGYEADEHVHEPETQSRAGADEEMDEGSAEYDTEHEIPHDQDDAADYVQEEAEAPTYEELEQEVAAETSQDFGADLAETFAEKDVELDDIEAPAAHSEHHDQSNAIEEPVEHVQEGNEDEADEADQLVEAVLQDFKNFAEEPQKPEPENDEVAGRIAVLDAEVEAEMREERFGQGSHQEADHDQEVDNDKPEVPAQQHDYQEAETVAEEHPAVVSAPEDLNADDDDGTESYDESEAEEDVQEAPVQEVVQEDEESEEEVDDEDDFDVDGTTLVVFDDNQMYMEGARLPSPRSSPRRASPRRTLLHRNIQVEREASPRQVESEPPQAPAAAVVDNQYRDDADEMDSDEDVQSNAGAANIQNDVQHETDRLESPETSAVPALNRRSSVHRSIFHNAPRFTPLANQCSQWQTSTPQEEEGSESTRPRRRGVFSIGGVVRRPSGRISVGSDVSYPDLSRQSLRSRKSSLANVTAQDVEDESMEPAVEVEQEPEQEPEPEPSQPEAEPETLKDAASKADEALPYPITEIYTDPEPEAEADERGEAPDSIPSQDVNSPAPAIAPSVHDHSDDEKENQNEKLPPPAPITPMKNKTSPLKTLHTVSKVPLKPEGEVSPLKMPLKRRRSLSNASPTRSSPRLRRSALFAPALAPEVEGNVPEYSPRKALRIMEEHASPARRASEHRARSAERRRSRASIGSKAPSQSPSPVKSRRTSEYRARRVERRQSRPSTKMPSRSPSPVKSPRKSIGGNAGVLQGAIVYVDVHTTEGEDASGIFVELLQQMGARCVKNWSWNPRASLLPTESSAEQKDGKVGITHVIYKDGGIRTLEKVRHAAGLVKCVGVGWVLDCERENKWLDETDYAVDSSIIPRGGAKRRKSMEPRALSNVNGTLVQTDSTAAAAAAARHRSGITPSGSSEEPRTPSSTRTKKYDTPNDNDRHCQTPKTPGTTYGYRFNMDDYVGMSPATPFYLSRARLVQQTCPPKQSRQGIFQAGDDNLGLGDVGVGGGDGESSRRLKMRLEAARRKSLAYKPRRASPLAD